MQSRRPLSPRASEADGRFGILRRLAQRLWLRWIVECRIRFGYAGARTRRFGRTVICQCAVSLGDVSDIRLRQRSAEEHLVASNAERRKAWLLRIDRTRFRIESWGYAHARKEGRQGICAQWRKDVDHVRHDRRCGGDLGQGRG